MIKVFLLCLVLFSNHVHPNTTKANKWIFIGYTVSEKINGCNEVFLNAGYVWIYQDENYRENLRKLEEQIDKTFPGRPYRLHFHPEYYGNAIVVAENSIYCSAKKITNLSYTFFSGKTEETGRAQVEKNKKNTTDITSYRILKIINYKSETAKLVLQDKRVVIGEKF